MKPLSLTLNIHRQSSVCLNPNLIGAQTVDPSARQTLGTQFAIWATVLQFKMNIKQNIFKNVLILQYIFFQM